MSTDTRRVPVSTTLLELGYLRPSDHGWRRRAACVDSDPELFFPQVGAPDEFAQIAAAQVVCGSCPVRAQCLDDVMAWEDPARRVGVFAGLTPVDRAGLFQIRREGLA
jgi:hypothetical protein